jgi:hypothetical protein
VRQAFVHYARDMGGLTALVVAVLAVALAVLYWVRLPAPGGFRLESMVQAFVSTSSGVYLVVLGVAMPFSLPLLLEFGVTRGRHARALLLAGVCTVAAVAMVPAVLGALAGVFNPLSALTAFARGCAQFLVGWLAALGWQFGRTLWSVVSTAAAAAMLGLLALAEEFGGGGLVRLGDEGLIISSEVPVPVPGMWPTPLLPLVLVSVALALIIVPLTSRIPVKA